MRFSLWKGKEMSAQEIEAVKQVERGASVRASALNYLSYRARSQVEVKRFLAAKGFDEELIASVLHELREQQWLDDDDFADRLAFERLRKGYGPLYIRHDLQRRGVEHDRVEAALAQVSEADWRRAALWVLDKKAASYRGLSLHEQAGKLCQLLLRRGFSQASARTWVKEFLADSGRIDFPEDEA